MSNATLARLGSDDYPWLYALRIVQCDQDKFTSFIAALKRHVSPRDRRWDAPNKRWLLKDDALVLYMLRLHGMTVECDDNAPPPTTHRAPVMDRAAALRLLHLQPDAPDWLVQAAYRAAAKKLHPDAGGDTEKMQIINQAMEVLR